MTLKMTGLKLPDIEAFDWELSEMGLYGLIGRNGIGKSTLFSVLSGEIAISQGQIESGRVAYLPGVENFDENLKLKDYFDILKTNEQLEALRLAQLFGADQFMKKRIGSYSLGMKQLSATILSFSVTTDILILDELLSGLDVAIKAKVYQELDALKQREIILLTSHHLKEIEHFCDKTYLLSEKGLSLVTAFDEAAKAIGYMDVFY